MRNLFLAIAALAYCATANANHFVVNFVKITDLGTLGGTDSSAQDINDVNEIVGWSLTPSGAQHAFVFTGGLMTDIGPSIGSGPSVATGINNSSQVVGWGFPGTQQMGYLWNSGVAKILVGTGAGTPTGATTATRINVFGDVSGRVFGSSDAITWQSSGTTIVMPTASRPGFALAINSTSSMTGYANGNVAWRWLLRSGMVVASAQIPYPAPTGYTIGAGTGINGRGECVGRMSLTSVGQRAFFWDGRSAKSIDIGTLASGGGAEAEDINDQRFIVGHATEPFTATPSLMYRERAFLYHSNFGMLGLPVLPATLRSQSCRAYAVNEWNSGSSRLQAVGNCATPTGTHAVVWDFSVSLVP